MKPIKINSPNENIRIGFLFVSFFLIFSSCKNNNNLNKLKEIRIDTIYVHDTIVINEKYDWQDFGLTHDINIDTIWHKPVSYYFNNKNCSPISKDFYLGAFRPSDDYTTDALLELACTNDNSLRPFYRWILNKTLYLSDGALAEHTGIPARKYAEKYPKELFVYFDSDSSSSKKYNNWTREISYSGYYDTENSQNPNNRTISNNMARVMKSNCKDCDATLIIRIEKFATDCFNK